jgi:ferredoxin
MKVTLKVAGEDHEIDVQPDEAIAAVAQHEGIQLYGSCMGSDLCGQCARLVTSKITTLLNMNTNKPMAKSDNPNFVNTCVATPTEDGVVIDCDKRARMW